MTQVRDAVQYLYVAFPSRLASKCRFLVEVVRLAENVA
jgi:hypothetical protein